MVQNQQAKEERMQHWKRNGEVMMSWLMRREGGKKRQLSSKKEHKKIYE